MNDANREVARRYLRFFKFIDCFDAGYKAWLVPAPLEADAVKKIAAVGKWSFLGVYFFMEDLTIVSSHISPFFGGNPLLKEMCSWMRWVFGQPPGRRKHFSNATNGGSSDLH